MTVLESLTRDLRHANPAVRACAAAALGRVADPTAVSFLLFALRDPAGSVRAEAAAALGHVRATGSVVLLCEAVSDPEPQVAAAACGALAELRDPRALPDLCGALESRFADVRHAAAAALAGYGAASGPALCGFLRHRRNTVRSAATAALAGMGAPAVACLCRALPQLCGRPQPGNTLVRMRVAALLAMVARQDPCPELQGALRPLQSWAGPFSSDGAQAKEIYRTALAAIAATQGSGAALPRPAGPPRGVDELPLPVLDGAARARSLPLSADRAPVSRRSVSELGTSVVERLGALIQRLRVRRRSDPDA